MKRTLLIAGVALALLPCLSAHADLPTPTLPQPWPTLVANCLRSHTCAMDCAGGRCAFLQQEPAGRHLSSFLWVGPAHGGEARAVALDFLGDGSAAVHWLDPDRLDVVSIPDVAIEGDPAPDAKPLHTVLRVGPKGIVPPSSHRRPSGASSPPSDLAACWRLDDEAAAFDTSCLLEDKLPATARQRFLQVCPSHDGEQHAVGVCTGSGCAVGRDDGPDGTCAAWIPAHGDPTRLPPLDSFSIDRKELCISEDLGCPTGCSKDTCFVIGEPLRLEIPPGPMWIGGRLDVPPEKAGTASRTVVSETAADLEYGQDTWDGPDDLSVRWTVTHSRAAVQVVAEVTDDHVIASAAKGPPVLGDHLELKLYIEELRVLLEESGRVEVRRWGRNGGSHEPVMATGLWTRTARGYRVEVSLPLPADTGDRFDAGFFVSDTDDGRTQKALIGTRVTLRLWSEFPPTISEFLRQE